MELRHRSGSIDSRADTVFTVDSIESASRWSDSTVKHLNVLVKDVSDMFSDCTLNDEAMQLTIPEWKSGNWLLSEDIDSMKHANRVKSLIAKIREVYIASTTISDNQSSIGCYVDGFMNTLLQILHFDDYPCLLYPQYTYSAKIGPRNHTVNAKSDFSVLHNKHQILLVIEDKTTSNANLTNNWKEDQVLGELFVAVHKAEVFPASVYAVRVVGTLSTFYRAIATEEYILETAKQGFAVKSDMTVQRHPPVKKSTQLTAYDICDVNDRKRILECMCSIRNF